MDVQTNNVTSNPGALLASTLLEVEAEAFNFEQCISTTWANFKGLRTCSSHDLLTKGSKERQWLIQLFLFSRSCRCRGLSKRALHVLWELVQRRASTAPVLSTSYVKQLRGVSLMRLHVTT